MRLSSLWLPFVLVGLLLMLGALAWAAAPIASLYSQALNDPLGGSGPSDGSEGKQLMKTVFMRLPLALPGMLIWMVGVWLRIKRMIENRREKARRYAS
jgi:hypothetical protein